MSNFNKVVLVGRLATDPILSYTPTGKPVTKFSIAINSYYKDGTGEKKQNVDFVQVTVWNKQAESTAEFLTKGKLALIDGRLKQEKWTTKEGQKRSTLSITADIVRFLSKSASMKADIPETPQDDNAQDDNIPAQEEVTST